jgi:hypothetical protein
MKTDKFDFLYALKRLWTRNLRFHVLKRWKYHV